MSTLAMSKLFYDTLNKNALKSVGCAVSCRCSSNKSPVQLMGLGRAVSRKEKASGPRKPRTKIQSLSKADIIDPDTTDWSSVYDAAQSYNPSVIPLPIRMGRPRPNRLGDVPPNDKGNIELLKIPNFFHLTPPAIKKHCEALKDYCTPWSETSALNRVIRLTTINFLYAGPSIRHPDSRKVKLQVYLRDLDLDDHARQKIVLLSGDRYNPATDELTISTDRCPTRKQNKEYAYYLLAALYHEAWKTEDWEEERIGKTDEQLKEEIRKANKDLNPSLEDNNNKNVKRQRIYRVINEKVVRYNRRGHPFVYEMRNKDAGYHIKGGLSHEEMQEAKKQWVNINKQINREDTFDPIYRRSSDSEFST